MSPRLRYLRRAMQRAKRPRAATEADATMRRYQTLVAIGFNGERALKLARKGWYGEAG